MAIFQIITFAFLALVSSFFTFNLAAELGTSPLEKFALVGGSLAIECIKLFALVKANSVASAAPKKRSLRKMLFLYGSYVLISAYSVLASFGYALSIVDRMEAQTRMVDYTERIQDDKKQIELIDDQIATFKRSIFDKQVQLGQQDQPNWQKAETQKRLDQDRKSFEEYRRERVSVQADLDRKQEAQDLDHKTRKRNMYEVIGDTIHVNGERVAFAVLFLFAMAIELGIFVTSPHGLQDRRRKPQEV